MDLKNEIYKLDKIYDKHLERVKKSRTLSKQNKKDLLDFIDLYCLPNNVSKHQMIKYLDKLSRVATIHKQDFRHKHPLEGKCPINNDFKRVFAEFHKRNWKPGTIKTYRSLMSAFLKWTFDLDSEDKVPCLKGIRTPKDVNRLRREDLVDDKEVEKMILATPETCYRAIVSCAYEGQLRAGEALNLTLSDVTFNEDHVILHVKGKMESKQGERKVHLLKSYDSLKDWVKIHPRNTEALWLMEGKPMNSQQWNKLCHRLAKKANLGKRVNPTLLRHSKITQNYLLYGESLAKRMAGHTPDSTSAKRYLHLTDDDTLAALRGELRPQVLEMKTTCHKCKHINSYNADFCKECHAALKLEHIKPVFDKEAVKEMIIELIPQLTGLKLKKPKKGDY